MSEEVSGADPIAKPTDELVALLESLDWDRGNHIADWPDDEAEAYREFGWQEGIDAANRIKWAKWADAIRAAIQAEATR